MSKKIFTKIHGKHIARKFAEPMTDKQLGYKLAEYSAITGVPVLICYEIYLDVVGPSDFVSNRIDEWNRGEL